MRHAKTIILVIVFIALLNFNLFSRISNRVSGIVKEAETNIPLKDVTIYLVEYDKDDPIINENDRRRRVRTDEAGKFRIDDIDKGTYFLTCEKIGYAALNPLYLAQENNPEDFLSIFFIDEGQIKYFEMTMKKGCSIKVTVLKSSQNGFIGVSNAKSWVLKKSKSIDPETGKAYYLKVSELTTNEYGHVLFNGLEFETEYEVSAQAVDNLVLLPERNKRITIADQLEECEFIYDFTDNTAIRLKLNYQEKKVEYTSIFITKIENGVRSYVTNLNITGEKDVFIPAFLPGNYNISVSNRYKEETEITTKRFSLNIKKGEISVLEVSF